MSDAALGPVARAAALGRMRGERFDLLVVGGGITGAGIALDAATRGLSVALVEAHDIAAGTSSRSSKLIHGGLRYLEMLDFGLVHEALRERGLIIGDLAPHLARGLPFILRAEHAWIVETLAGDAAAAEDEIRAAYEVLERWEMGEKGLLSTQAARLAQSLYAQQRYEEAEHQTRISEQAGASDDMMTQVLWRQVRAKALARRGEDGAAEDLAREAVALVEPTDALDMRADALVDLAEVLRLVGRKEEPKGVLEDALRLYERKGNVVSAARARDVLANAVRTCQTPPP